MTSALIIQTRKEVRALLPWTVGVALACVALASVAAQNGGFPNFRHDQELFFVIAYVLGSLSIAALSVGQELTHGTLAALLVQPHDRLNVLTIKMTVLAIALVGLALVTNAVLPHTYLPDAVAVRRLIVWGPVVAGIGLVPLLTIVTRRPLGGVVFAATGPGLILIVAERMYPLRHGLQALTIAWWGIVIASAIGFVALLVQFRRLEVAGDGRQRSAPVATGTLPLAEYRPTVRRPWMWLLVKKELRLQQMTLAVSGLYLLAAVGVMVVASLDPNYVGPTFNAISMLHAYFVPLIAGSLASAEERHIGALAGQILQPRNIRVQWAIKVVVTIGLALALAFGLPYVLMQIDHPANAFKIETDFMVGVAMLTAAAMYVSSLSSNPLWALLACFPAIGAATVIGGYGRKIVWSTVSEWFFVPWDQRPWRVILRIKEKSYWAARHAAQEDVRWSVAVIEMSLIVAFALLVLYFASRNHRMLDRNPRTLGRQLLVLGAFAAAAFVLYRAIVESAWNLLNY